jgi:pyruvate dehydrogenase E1 component alpha subunit
LIEARTYRFWGHLMGDAMEYMPKEERKAAMAADPVPAYRTWLLENGHATEAELNEIEDQIKAMVDDAVEFALNSPEPSLDELYTDVYEEIIK